MTAWVADRFPGFARHLAVLRAAWAAQDRTEHARRPISDHEVLPAALEIMERPPSPGLRALLEMIRTVFAAALLWSVLGTVDVVAAGKIIPSTEVEVIQPMEIGAVRAIPVANGQHVAEGDLLVQLDPTSPPPTTRRPARRCSPPG
ncbi:biotin/lipoyl-binding protein [Methylobacterium indicum]|uniref:Membrane fusion protein biotin-lipoyl like domain-containing protein n=1 Tax=Methylobacterium indicum TaxID=1775910 RepID=A0A8H8WYZ5_9HYPH|nr:biotin/lipoyl-binding protein [Methylobacterium indicum]BCM86709.1 hypothetical protein mvi_51700 [Methylobacterium indicum]